MAEHFRGQPLVSVFCTPNRGLIDFLETILAGLDVQQSVGEEFTQERLAELGAVFNLADSDWEACSGKASCPHLGLEQTGVSTAKR